MGGMVCVSNSGSGAPISFYSVPICSPPPILVKQLWSDVNLSPPYTTEVKNEWGYTLILQYAIMSSTRKNCTFLWWREPLVCVDLQHAVNIVTIYWISPLHCRWVSL